MAEGKSSVRERQESGGCWSWEREEETGSVIPWRKKNSGHLVSGTIGAGEKEEKAVKGQG